MVKRKCFIVYYESYDLAKYNNINIVYHSEKYNYAVCYCDYEYYNNVKNKLINDKTVLNVEESLLAENCALLGVKNEN